MQAYRILILICLSGLFSCTYLLTPKVEQKLLKLRQGEYKLDSKHTSVLFKIQHMQLSTFVGRFNQFDATLDFDPEKPEKTRLQAWVAANSIDVNNVDLAESLSDDWLKSKTYPKINVKTLSVEPSTKNNQFIFNAELTLLGVTKPIKLEAIFHGGASNLLTGFYTLGFSAKGSIKRSDFGMDQYIPLVGDQVDLEIYAEFQKQ